jgi:hypothetical protein
MPSTTPLQARFMAACAHGADYSSCPPAKVSHEFNQADKGTGILKRKGRGGIVRGRPPGALKMAAGGATQIEETARQLGGQSFQAMHDPALRASMKARLMANPALLQALTSYAGRYLPPGFANTAMSAFSKSPGVGGTGKPAAQGADPDEVLSTLTRALYYQSAGSIPQQAGADPNARPVMPQQTQPQSDASTSALAHGGILHYARGRLASLAELLKETPEQTALRQASEARAARVSQPGFFSTLTQLVGTSPKAAMKPAEWKDYLQPGTPLKRGDVTFRLKPEEIEHTGVHSFLDQADPNTPIKRAELQTAIRANRPDVKMADIPQIATAQQTPSWRDYANSIDTSGSGVSVSSPRGSPTPNKYDFPRDLRTIQGTYRGAPNVLAYGEHYESPLGGTVITGMHSAPHQAALDVSSGPTAEALDKLRSLVAGTNADPEANANRFHTLQESLGLGHSITPAGEAPATAATAHPMLTTRERGYGTAAPSPDLAGPFDPINAALPFKGTAAWTSLLLRKHLLDAAQKDKNFLGVLNASQIDPHRLADQFQTNNLFGNTFGVEKQLRKLAAQYELPLHEQMPIDVLPNGRQAPEPPIPEEYHDRYLQGAYSPDSVTRPTNPNFAEHQAGMRKWYEDASGAVTGGNLRNFNRRTMQAANQIYDKLNELPLHELTVGERSALAQFKPAMDENMEELNTHVSNDQNSYTANPMPADRVAALHQHVAAAEGILNAHHQRAMEAFNAPGEAPTAKGLGVDLQGSLERLKKIGVPLWSLAPPVIGMGMLGQHSQGPSDGTPQLAGGGFVRSFGEGGSKGVLHRLAQLATELPEDTAARQAQEMARAKYNQPGMFSPLAEVLHDPSSIAGGLPPALKNPDPTKQTMRPQDWQNFLRTAVHARQGMQFKVEPKEMEFSGLGPWLAQKVATEPDTRLSLADLQQAHEALRPALKVAEKPQSQYATYMADWMKRLPAHQSSYSQTMVSAPELSPVTTKWNNHFEGSDPGALMWNRGHYITQPDGTVVYQLGESQSDITGHASDKMAMPPPRRALDLAHFAAQTPVGVGDPKAAIGEALDFSGLAPRELDMTSDTRSKLTPKEQELGFYLGKRGIGAGGKGALNQFAQQHGIGDEGEAIRRYVDELAQNPDNPKNIFPWHPEQVSPRIPFTDTRNTQLPTVLRLQMLLAARKAAESGKAAAVALPDVYKDVPYDMQSIRASYEDVAKDPMAAFREIPAPKQLAMEAVYGADAGAARRAAQNPPLEAPKVPVGIMHMAASDVAKKYGITKDPAFQVWHPSFGPPAQQPVTLPKPANYVKPDGTPAERFSTITDARAQALYREHSAGRINTNQYYQLHHEFIADQARQALEHYANLPWPAVHAADAAQLLREGHESLANMTQQMATLPPQGVDHAGVRADVGALDRLVESNNNPSAASNQPLHPDIQRHALTMTPEQAALISKVGVTPFKQGGAVDDEAAMARANEKIGGWENEIGARLHRLKAAAEPLWMGRDSHGNIVTLASHLHPATEMDDPLTETGLGDAIAGTPAALEGLVKLVGRYAGSALRRAGAQGSPIDTGIAALNRTAIVGDLMRHSQSASDMLGNLTSDVYGKENVPEQPRDRLDSLIDIGGSMLGSPPIPGGIASKLGRLGNASKLGHGLGVMEYIMPTIEPKPMNYLMGTLGGTLLDQAAQHVPTGLPQKP